MNAPLSRIVPWGHRLAHEVLRPGDLAVDLTAGTGQDCLRLFECVGSLGQVLAFDIQPAALEATRRRLEPLGARVVAWSDGPVPREPGVFLLSQGHQQLQQFLPGAPRAVLANLGYLPGSDGCVTTRPDTTLDALNQAAEALQVGGRLIVAVYIGHSGGAEEGEAVDAFFRELPMVQWQTLRLAVPNAPVAPFLLAAEKQA